MLFKKQKFDWLPASLSAAEVLAGTNSKEQPKREQYQSKSNFCFLNSIQNRRLCADRIRGGSDSVTFSPKWIKRAGPTKRVATTIPIAESGIGTIKAPTRLALCHSSDEC